MLPIPQNCLTRFNQALQLSAVPVPFHVHWRKWLRYLLDFCGKYPPPDAKSEKIRFEDGVLTVHGKGDKDRSVPLPQRIMPELKDPLETVSAQKKLTPIPGTKELRRYHLHESQVQIALKKAVRRAKLTKRVTSHTFQTMLGHADVRTTMIYTHCVPSKTVKEARSPLDF